MERIPQGLTPEEFLAQADRKHELKTPFKSPVTPWLGRQVEVVTHDSARHGSHLSLQNSAS